MHNHLELYNQMHQERVKQAERERLAQQMRKANPPPNQAMLKLGELLVDMGEEMQYRAQPRRRRA